MHGAKKHKRSVYLSVFLRLLDIFLSILKDFHTTVNCLKIVMPDNINLKKTKLVHALCLFMPEFDGRINRGCCSLWGYWY